LTNLTTGQLIPTANITVTYDLGTNTAHFTFPGYPLGILPDGNYSGKILAGLPDFFGNALPDDAPFSFFVLGGDANQDAVVNIDDLSIVAGNFMQTGKVFSQGDFNYDGGVNELDLGVLAANWMETPEGTTVSGAPMPSVAGITQPAQPPPRAMTPFRPAARTAMRPVDVVVGPANPVIA
jgi:hypothetical protein